jgi:hypothetical protein
MPAAALSPSRRRLNFGAKRARRAPMPYSRLIGLFGVAMAALALPAAALDSALGGLLLLGALVLGGLSCLGWRTDVRYAATSLFIAIGAALALSRYSSTTGAARLGEFPPLELAALAGVPLAPALLLVALEYWHRRRQRSPKPRPRRVSARARIRRS